MNCSVALPCLSSSLSVYSAVAEVLAVSRSRPVWRTQLKMLQQCGVSFVLQKEPHLVPTSRRFDRDLRMRRFAARGGLSPGCSQLVLEARPAQASSCGLAVLYEAYAQTEWRNNTFMHTDAHDLLRRFPPAAAPKSDYIRLRHMHLWCPPHPS